MSQWCRLWEDMPNDPKWRVVARRAKRPVSEVLAVFVHMMVNAANASERSERGNLEGWSDEDVAIAIDAETEHVATIREAMQGKTLEGDHLTGWERRQPLREDGSAERAKAWREQKRLEAERLRTQPNAAEPPEEKRIEPIETKKTRGREVDPISEDWGPNQADRDFAELEGLPIGDVEREAGAFRDHWLRSGEPQADWSAAWRGWVREAVKRRRKGGGRGGGSNGSSGAPAAPGHVGERMVHPPGLVKPVSIGFLIGEAKAGRWRDVYGPKRGEPGCVVPERVFQEAG